MNTDEVADVGLAPPSSDPPAMTLVAGPVEQTGDHAPRRCDLAFGQVAKWLTKRRAPRSGSSSRPR